MTRKLIVAALFLILAIPAAGTPAPGESELGQRIRARLDAYRQGDAAAWVSFVSDDCFCAGEKKADIVRSIENRPPGGEGLVDPQPSPFLAKS